jgi:hypothetical protein
MAFQGDALMDAPRQDLKPVIVVERPLCPAGAGEADQGNFGSVATVAYR